MQSDRPWGVAFTPKPRLVCASDSTWLLNGPVSASGYPALYLTLPTTLILSRYPSYACDRECEPSLREKGRYHWYTKERTSDCTDPPTLVPSDTFRTFGSSSLTVSPGSRVTHKHLNFSCDFKCGTGSCFEPTLGSILGFRRIVLWGSRTVIERSAWDIYIAS